MAIAEWESYVLTCRIKTKRNKKRIVREAQDKKLIHLNKELKRVQREQRNLGYADLIPPVQRGWKREFTLRPDLLRSKDADFFISLLGKINTTQYSHRKDFKVKRKRRGKKVQVERLQILREFYQYELPRMKLTEKEQTFFKIEWRVSDRGHLYPKTVFSEPWRFILKIKPNMITQIKIIDPELKSLEKQIENYLDRNALTPRMCKLVRGSYGGNWWKGTKPQYRFRSNKLSVSEIENELN